MISLTMILVLAWAALKAEFDWLEAVLYTVMMVLLCVACVIESILWATLLL